MIRKYRKIVVLGIVIASLSMAAMEKEPHYEKKINNSKNVELLELSKIEMNRRQQSIVIKTEKAMDLCSQFEYWCCPERYWKSFYKTEEQIKKEYETTHSPIDQVVEEQYNTIHAPVSVEKIVR